jgi:hypothetical protein
MKAFAAKWNDDDTIVVVIAKDLNSAILAWWDWQRSEKNDGALYDEADDLGISANDLLCVTELPELAAGIFRIDG